MADPLVRLPFKGDFNLTQGFGEHPETYKRFSLPGHNGLDWSMPVGTPIYAVDAGKVVLLDNVADGFGLHVKLEHTWGQSLYAHLDRCDVKLNDTVKVGDKIAHSGNSGFSTGPHLHFGVRINPYSAADGWYGYTNPQRFLVWGDVEKGLLQRVSDLVDRLRKSEENLATATGSFQFQKQELTEQADLWRESVTALLKRHIPGELPPDADVLATLESLIQTWADEVEQLRRSTISSVFGSTSAIK